MRTRRREQGSVRRAIHHLRTALRGRADCSPATVITHDIPVDRDNRMHHDRQHDQRQDRRTETTILDKFLLDGGTGSTVQT